MNHSAYNTVTGNTAVHLCLVLHNHQPIGNFEGVFEQAYNDSYRPFLDVLEEYPGIHLSLHTSGPLMLWLADKHPEYIQRLARLVAAGCIEIIGGPMYEPILTMLPSRDRVGQIQAYTNYLTDLFQTEIRGMWMPERVWESNLTADIAAAGISYTVLDDFHFTSAGWPASSLIGSFITEDNGCLLRIFPGSERLRYLIPFADVDATIDYARQVAGNHPGAVLVFGDDGEKFGTWPDTHQHVYQRGWLRRFFDALVDNQSWLKTSTLNEAAQAQPAHSKIYLPECSYREMTQWALPADVQQHYDHWMEIFSAHPNWSQIQPFVRAGNWRNFRVRYTEANEMYCRMLQVSRKAYEASQRCGDSELLDRIEDHLYRGQCNCPYWHGAFGGIYLPHLRNAVYHELIAADNLLDYLEHGKAAWVEATTDDYNLDLRNEVRLANDHWIAYVAPSDGGMLYELDSRFASHNLLATMQRRPEAYHAKIMNLANPMDDHHQSSQVESIHDRVVCKQEGLQRHLQYDNYPRKSFIDHFYDNDLSLAALMSGQAIERGDFVGSAYEAKLRRAASKVQLQLTREGNAWGMPFRLTKALTMQAGSSTLEVAYLIEGLPPDRQLHLALEWNFAGLPADADDRYFYDATGDRLGHLGTALEMPATFGLGMIDGWQGIDVSLQFDRQTSIWTYPIQTVSQSEGGFELVHQSVCVMPHWLIQGDREGRWSLQMTVAVSHHSRPQVFVPHMSTTLATTGVTGLSTM
ncbi:MAG: DUF1926 domain-containing protein [Pirellulaceae bacterium]|nr:DUF1926 domain-containing protein [Pirellulaceae bacterium]